MRRAVRVFALIAVLTLTSAACGSDKPRATSGTPSGTNTPPASSSDAKPSSRFKTGTAKIEITGEVTKTIEYKLSPDKTTWNPAPSGMAIFYSNDKGGALGIGGGSQTGSRATSPSVMTFTFTDTSETFLIGISSKGECTVNVTKSDADGVDATADCQKWVVSNKTLNVHATMTARP
ncbi:MAG: hypothetical protein NVSMB57_13560 [Actinomycetota bacterium]